MAHYRGTIQGSRGEASRLGHKSTGLVVEAQSWSGKIVTRLFERDGQDMAVVSMEPHKGTGVSRILYEGPVSA